MTQLGLIGLCKDITKKIVKSRVCGGKYVDITINGKPARVMVKTGEDDNIMTKTKAKKFGLHYSQSSTNPGWSVHN